MGGFFLFGFLFIFSESGERQAERKASGVWKTKIEFQLTENIDLPKELCLITYSKNKYFVGTKKEGDKKPKVFAIENSKVLKAEIIK